LKIRDEQIETMRQGVRREYERRVLDHIARYFSQQMRLFGRERLHPLAARSIDQASSYQMVSEESTYVYADAMMLLGVDFDVDPQLPFAGAILRDPGLSERERAAKLYDAGKDYWLKVAGSDGGGWKEALRNFRKFPVDWSRQPSDAGYREVASGLLARLYPSKHTFLGDVGVENFLQYSADKGTELGIATRPGIAVLAALMFLGGAGFLNDPRFDWIEPFLGEPARRQENWLARLHEQTSQRFEEWGR
jgi:hypothetical protein